jgi:hypothetical protein
VSPVDRGWLVLPVDFIEVPRRWRVGRCTIAPAHDVARRLGANTPTRSRFQQDVLAQFDAAVADAATIRIPIRITAAGRAVDGHEEAANNEARDALAVLRLLQEVRVPYFDATYQRFGLRPDVGRTIEPRLLCDTSGRIRTAGWTAHGVGGAWTFTHDDLRFYRHDHRFQWLDMALKTTERHRTDWQRRVLTALRTVAFANRTQRSSMRIVLLATAIEALLGDPFVPGRAATSTNVIANRAAYLWCGTDFQPPDPHGVGGRPRCAFFDSRNPWVDPTLHPRPGKWACSFWGALRTLFDDRNAALHGAETRFSEKAANQHEYTIDKVMVQTLVWIQRASPTSIADLDAEIAALP